MLIDTHQHLWSEPLMQALSRRRELPFVRREHGLAVLFSAGEQPYVIEPAGELPSVRAALVRADGLDRALIALSSPLGVESLPRRQARELLDAYHEGALALGEPFGVWAALALDELDPDDVEEALDRGCVGLSLPAAALGGLEQLARVSPALSRLQERGAPLFVHPGRGGREAVQASRLGDPLWWPALTRYVAETQAAWLLFATSGRRIFPRLRVVFAMLGGLAPLHAERLLARGGPRLDLRDPLTFYDVSSYGPRAADQLAALVGERQLVYGSDRPVVGAPAHTPARAGAQWTRYAANAARLLEPPPPPPPPPRAARRGARRVAVLTRAVS